MGLGADLLNLTQSSQNDFLKNVWAAINRVGDELTDRLVNGSGWVVIPLASGIVEHAATPPVSYTPMVRKIGTRLYFRGAIDPASGWAANSSYTIGTLPAGFAPLQTLYLPATANTPGNGGMTLYASSGTVQIRTGATVGTYYFLHPGPLFTD